jgi:hypothetical protein
MRVFDPTPGTGRLRQAMETLDRQWAATREHWHDEAGRQFEERHLEPLRSELAQALVTIHQLADVLARAERECGPD